MRRNSVGRNGAVGVAHEPWLVLLSLSVAIQGAYVGLSLAVQVRDSVGVRRRLLLAAAPVSPAVALLAMHFGALLAGRPPFPVGLLGFSPLPSLLVCAIVVAIVAFIVSGIFLLTLVPERTRNAADLRPAAAEPDAEHDDLAVAPAPAAFAPLGAAGGPPRRIARQLPVEHDGGIHFVPVEDVVAVHANAHYTYIFDGKVKFFCPLAIGVVESRLDSGRFVRIHRSHIVALDRIVGLKRMGDTGVIELAAGEPYTVPVSRGRLPWLKARLATTIGDFSRGRGSVPQPSLAVASDFGQHA